MSGSAGRSEKPAARLWKWFQKNARDLPWRRIEGRGERREGRKQKNLASRLSPFPSGSRDPYHVWLAEIMLQQTQVKTVIPYYEKFLRHYPNLRALARASQEKVLSDWAGLGYYSRARNLHACAIFVTEQLGGVWPKTSADLQKLPGLGPYTAAAMAALAFGENTVALDGNVARVIARVGMIKKPVATARAEYVKVGETLLHKAARGGSAEALIELGALVCTPKNPKCGECPISADCKAFQRGEVNKFPVKIKKTATKTRAATAMILTNSAGEVFTITRGGNGLFARMLALPTSALQPGEAHHPLFEKYHARAKTIGAVEHILTHVKFVFSVSHTKLSTADAKKITVHGAWMDARTAIRQMPKLFAKAIAHADAAVLKRV